MPFAGRLHDCDRGSSLLDVDQHNLLGHEKGFRFYVLNLQSEVRKDFLLLQDSCIQSGLPLVGRAGTCPIPLPLLNLSNLTSAISFSLCKLNLNLMEVLFFDLSL